MNINDLCFINKGKRMPFTEADFSLPQPINLRGAGRNRALLLIHGFASTPAVFRLLIPQLKGYDAIVCPALPGHADSTQAFLQCTAAEWDDSMLTIAKELASNYQSLDVLGLSLGGLLACEISKQVPINHLYLLAPVLELYGDIRLYRYGLHLLQFFGVQLLNNKTGGNILNNSNQELTYKQLSVHAIQELLELIRQFSLTLPSCPTDVFFGCHDKVVGSKAIAARFANHAHIRIHWLKNSAHVLPLDNDLDAIVDCINKGQ